MPKHNKYFTSSDKPTSSDASDNTKKTKALSSSTDLTQKLSGNSHVQPEHRSLQTLQTSWKTIANEIKERNILNHDISHQVQEKTNKSNLSKDVSPQYYQNFQSDNDDPNSNQQFEIQQKELENRAKKEVVDEVANIINTTIEENSSAFKDAISLTRSIGISNLKTDIARNIQDLCMYYHNSTSDNQESNILNSAKADYLAEAIGNEIHRNAISLAIERAERRYAKNIFDSPKITKGQNSQDLSQTDSSKNSYEYKLSLIHEDKLPHSLERGTYLRNETTGMILQMPHQEDLKTKKTITSYLKEAATIIEISQTSIHNILEKDDVVSEWYHYKTID